MQVRNLLAWAIAQGVELTRITVGSCTVDMAPARPVSTGKPTERPPREAIYAQMGGERFREAVERGDLDGELQPVVGRR